MSVLIKDMRLPKSCYECNLKVICDYASMNGWISNRRDSMCPLVEVKEPHGDLVDRDELLAEYDKQHKGLAGGARKIMVDAKAVIEAEGSKDE